MLIYTVASQNSIAIPLQLNAVAQVRGDSTGRIAVEHRVVQHGTVLRHLCGEDLLLLRGTHSTAALLGHGTRRLGGNVLQGIRHHIEGQQRLFGLGLLCLGCTLFLLLTRLELCSGQSAIMTSLLFSRLCAYF